MNERAQWLCEMAGLAALVLGLVVVGASLWGGLGAGTVLLVVAVPLLVVGNLRRGDS